MPEKLIGEVVHYFGRLGVAVIEPTDRLALGDAIRFRSPDEKKGAITDFVQVVASLQLEHIPTKEAVPGQLVAVKVDQKVRIGDRLYKVD